MSLSHLLVKALPAVKVRVAKAVVDRPQVNADVPAFTLFFSLSDGSQRASVVNASAATFEAAWQAAASKAQRLAGRSKAAPTWLRIDWVTQVKAQTWSTLAEQLKSVKRNYFRYGLALDARFTHAFLEQELNANAMLYGGASVPHTVINQKNFSRYARRKYGLEALDLTGRVYRFATEGVFVSTTQTPVLLHGPGRNAGRRAVARLDVPQVETLIRDSSRYLTSQVRPSGKFHYGWHPCFDREINAYNTLRHASSTYAMLEAWEVTGDPQLKTSIELALHYLTRKLIKHVRREGRQLAFLTEANGEIKLGGNAVCLLALTKHAELTGSQEYRPLIDELAEGILFMQNAATGGFVHVLTYPDLNVKEAFRIIYYDGEAAFGLMRTYELTGNVRWLDAVERAFGYFIAKEHWRAHDHWLSYCVNELTRYRPEARYYAFGIQNVAGYLDFVLERITTFPTLLELMMAAEKMVTRLQQDPALHHLLEPLDLEKFYRALEHRAHYLLNGHFWPELAMFFENPARILGSFFIRHHSFRVRIDDVEHYLSGFVAYRKYLLATSSTVASSTARKELPAPTEPSSIPCATIAWGGDVNLGRRQHYRTAELGATNVLGQIPALNQADLTIVNLECVVATCGQQGVEKGESGAYYYRARPEMLDVLTQAGVDVVVTANNHSGDYGAEALCEQPAWLEAAGIAHTGTGRHLEAALQPVVRHVGKGETAATVALFSLDATQPHFAATATTPGAAYLSLKEPDAWRALLEPRIVDIRLRAAADIVLVALHWGDNHEATPSSQQRAVGHAVIDAGADAILGASAHCLQGIEVYRGKPIIHDAGDLLFDAIRQRPADGAVFTLEVAQRRIQRMVVTPVGIGFGQTRLREGDAARAALERFAGQCQALGSTLALFDDHAALTLPVDAVSNALMLAEKSKSKTGRKIAPVIEPASHRVPEVPAAARIEPHGWGDIHLLGVGELPGVISQRQILWVETFWRCDALPSDDYRIDIRAMPEHEGEAWGLAMDHDPCDWQLPMRRWRVGECYRDRYGLRPPSSRRLVNGPLRLEIRLVSAEGKRLAAYYHPQRIMVALRPSLPQYRQQFAEVIHAGAPGETWSAEQLQAVTGGVWLVPPPPGWYVSSIINGRQFVAKRPAPRLFVAHDNHDRAFHEGSTRPIIARGDRHLVLAAMHTDFSGAIVSRRIADVPPDFPQLQVADPIKALIELGLAARARYTRPVIAVTGTAGKSSTIGLLETLFPPETVLKSIDNYNSRVGAPAQLACLAPWHRAALIEVAQSALWMQRGPVTRLLRPTIAILTEVGLSQTNAMVKRIEDVAKWKSRIFDGLVPGGVAILGEHLACYEAIHTEAKRLAARVVTYGESPAATLRLVSQSRQADGTLCISLIVDDERLELVLPFASPGMRNNALAVLATAYALEMDLHVAAQGFSRLEAEEGRLEHYTVNVSGQRCYVIDDSWNAEVISMLNAFAEFAAQPCDGRRIAVLGRIVHLGDMASTLHASLEAPLVASGVDLVLTHGEEMRALREVLPETLLGPHFTSATVLAEHLETYVRDNDLLLLKGSRRDSDFGEISTWLKQRRINEVAANTGSSVPYLLSDMGELAAKAKGHWQGGRQPVLSSVQNIAYLTKHLTPGSIGVVTPEGVNFGFPPRLARRYKDRFVALMGSLEENPVPELPYLKTGPVLTSFRQLAECSRQRFGGKVIGVTGSAGKSSTVSMLEAALGSLHGVERVATTDQNENLQLGTMRALTLLRGEKTHLVLEIAAEHAAKCSAMSRPHAALFTNLSYAHAALYGELDAIADRKAGIFEHLAPEGVAVLCRDMALFTRVRDHALAHGAHIVTYGEHAEADVRLLDYDVPSGRVTASAMGQPIEFVLSASGRHMAINSLGVIATLKAIGEDWEQAFPALEGWRPLVGRGERFVLSTPSAENVEVIDDAFNAAPIAMQASLTALSMQPSQGRRLAVLGEMLELGAKGRELHDALATTVATCAADIDKFYVLGEAYDGFWQSLPASKKGHHAHSVEALKTALMDDLKSHDTVLVKGSHGTRVFEIVSALRGLHG